MNLFRALVYLFVVGGLYGVAAYGLSMIFNGSMEMSEKDILPSVTLFVLGGGYTVIISLMSGIADQAEYQEEDS